ncbi:Homeobox-leucine zipper protein PROTODERMAL FACTOR 2, partial [Sesamum alatum]
TLYERHENSNFHIENNKLRAENIRCKEALSSARCCACGRAIVVVGMSSNEHCLRVENGQLREQIEHLAAITAKFVGKPLGDNDTVPSSATSLTVDTDVVQKFKGNQKIDE